MSTGVLRGVIHKISLMMIDSIDIDVQMFLAESKVI